LECKGPHHECSPLLTVNSSKVVTGAIAADRNKIGQAAIGSSAKLIPLLSLDNFVINMGVFVVVGVFAPLSGHAAWPLQGNY